jgi:hypothetical protein
MSKVISVAIKATNLSAYWVSVDAHDVKLTNSKGSVNLKPGPHVLVWWMLGNPGGSLGIELTDSRGNVVAKVKESKIPEGETMSAGSLRFKL